MSAYFQVRDFDSNIRMNSAPGSAPVRGLNHQTESWSLPVLFIFGNGDISPNHLRLADLTIEM
jgi:hypothetical protein